MREIPWFSRRGTRRLGEPARRLSAFLEADLNAFDTAEGEQLFDPMYTVLAAHIEWADDPDMPAPYRVVRGWQER